ncbi:DUF411 domain-containing protein [Natrarchaeobaculum aegyptiacum]|uniref:Metal-binding protein n=1 Tax=Natrarchaeobaculum aegyptiacum TaxID=745377 RepID=A0A2Z2HUT3_9EURY|nr:DUF411 domain-containing protein [Natrarchaeobaculum aegyptiacum]ARS90952.1 hypothetical protein B1756_15250 [Natrarchaeobaculum aegyptiacum]
MKRTRRQLLAGSPGIATVAVAGCLERLADVDPDSAAGVDSGPRDTGSGTESDDHIADWAWSGSLPIDSALQYHDPDCGCCHEYVTYLEEHDLAVDVEPVDDLPAVKTDLSVPDEVRSCHTLVLETPDGVDRDHYLVEGHVPLEAIETLYDDQPAADGIAVPGMPRHSPGMGPRGDDPVAVYAFSADGSVLEFDSV